MRTISEKYEFNFGGEPLDAHRTCCNERRLIRSSLKRCTA